MEALLEDLLEAESSIKESVGGSASNFIEYLIEALARSIIQEYLLLVF